MIALVLTQLAAANTPLVDALEEELQRNIAELTLPNSTAPYHIQYRLSSTRNHNVDANFGGLTRYRNDPSNILSIEVRVGSSQLDNSNFGGWENGFGRTYLPDYPTPHAYRMSAWLETDRQYKHAVEQLARKTAQFVPPSDFPGDYQVLPARTSIAQTPVIQTTGEELQALAERLSSAVTVGDRTTLASAHIGTEHGLNWVLDSEGTRVAEPISETSVRVNMHIRAEDGMLLTDSRLWCTQTPDELEPDAMVTELSSMATELQELADAPVLEDEYVGPVIFEGTAATDLFRHLLVRQLEGTPAETPIDTFMGGFSDQKSDVRLNRRVLPSGWSVRDDPQHQPNHPSTMRSDFEGAESLAVDLVQSGIVRNLMMSRVPRKQIQVTNGHARGSAGERQRARATQLIIQPPKQVSSRSLQKRALKVAANYGRDWIVVVKTLQEPTSREMGEEIDRFADKGPPVPMPVRLVRLYADGREEVLRGATFVGIQRWVLRDIVAAGPTRKSTYLAPFDDGYYGLGPTGGLATWIEAPDVLIGEVEIAPAPADPLDKAVLPPLADQ